MLETGDLVDAPTDTRAARCVRAATVLPLSGVILLVGFQDCLRGLPSGADSPAFPPSQAPPRMSHALWDLQHRAVKVSARAWLAFRSKPTPHRSCGVAGVRLFLTCGLAKSPFLRK